MLKVKSLVLVVCVLLVVVPALAQDAETTVSLGSSEELGSYLVGPDGMTLYSFTPDSLNQSVCNGQCAENWPPLTVLPDDELTAAEGIPGVLGTTTRDDGELQVTYNGMPLYYWINDAQPGDMTGQRVGHVWWIVPPATVAVLPNADLGPILTGPTGMTVYQFANDEPGVSNCTGDCAANWPPLTVESADDLVAGANLPGEWGTAERDDGALQVTYNGWPLYYWKDDAAIGDATGEGVGDVWFTIAPETVALSSSDELGDFLVSADGMTLYTFANDEAGVINCTGDCAENWPPFTVGEGAKLVAGMDIEGELATIAREDGALQVTYNGLPLYFWKDDKAPGDTTGQGVGEVWAVAAA